MKRMPRMNACAEELQKIDALGWQRMLEIIDLIK